MEHKLMPVTSKIQHLSLDLSSDFRRSTEFNPFHTLQKSPKHSDFFSRFIRKLKHVPGPVYPNLSYNRLLSTVSTVTPARRGTRRRRVSYACPNSRHKQLNVGITVKDIVFEATTSKPRQPLTTTRVVHTRVRSSGAQNSEASRRASLELVSQSLLN